MCRSSSEVGGPRRCSGDTRAAYERAAQELTRLERARALFGPDFREARARAAAEELGWPESAVEEAGKRARAQAEAEAEAASPPPAAADPEAPSAAPTTVLCRSCWQKAIMFERKTGVSRLRGYRRMHPQGADKQCGGKTWW